jgi:ADP-heptose:LPS heptosyltransferase
MKIFGLIKKLDFLAGPLVIFILKKSSKLILRKTGKIDKILLIKFGNIGDVIMTVPAIRAVRKKFPDAKITILTSNRTCGLYEQYSYIDKVINEGFVEDKSFFENFILTLIGALKLAGKIRKENFDLVIDLETYSTFSACLSFVSGAGIRAGIDFKSSFRGKLYTHSMSYIKENRHELDTFLELVSLIGAKTTNKETEIKISKNDMKYADNLMKNLPNRKTIAVHSGGNPDWPIKRWPEKNFSELIEFLIKKYRANIILIGSKDEKEMNEELKNRIDGKIINVAGKTSINQLASLLSKCDFFVGNDSAPMHIAAAVKTKTIGIMTCVNPKRWGPYGKNNIAITNASPDNPYWNGYFGKANAIADNRIDLPTIEDITNAIEKINSLK